MLAPYLPQDQRKTLESEQAVIDKDQDASQSDEHAMTGITADSQNEAVQRTLYISRTELLLQTSFRNAIDARNQGKVANGLIALAKALHALQDATSPAHRGFQPWKASFGIWEVAQHVMQERLYPVDDATHFYKSRLEGVVKYAYDIYTGAQPLPARFFSDTGCLLKFDPDCRHK